MYGYFKMRQNTSKKGRIPKNHGHTWTGEPNSLHLVSYDYMSDIVLRRQEVDHMYDECGNSITSHVQCYQGQSYRSTHQI